MAAIVQQIVSQSLVLLVLITISESYRIMILPTGFGSHTLYMNQIGGALSAHGHDVYSVVGSHVENTDFITSKGMKVLKYQTPTGEVTYSSKEFKEGTKAGNDQVINLASKVGIRECENMIADEKFMSTVGELKFDLAVVHGFILTRCLFLIPHIHDIPYVYDFSGLDPVAARNPSLPSFVPFTQPMWSDHMTFIERCKNVFIHFIFYGPFPSLTGVHYMSNFSLIEQHRKDPSIKTWQDLSGRSLLFLVNRGYLLQYPEPSMPNVIHLEGLTINPPKPLPQELLKLANKATQGVVIVSFGSGIVEFKKDEADKMLEAFKQRKEIFIWRAKLDLSEITLPDNVVILDWLPQGDVLAHKHTKLFITHCGNNGQYEALYNGIPMLGMPVFAEQHHNAHRVVAHGYGLMLDFHSFTTTELIEALNALLDNDTYRKKIQKASAILRDAPMNATETAVYWIEHVIKFGGDHLRSAAFDLSIYQWLMLDILVVLLVVGLIITLVILGLMYILYNKFCVGKSEKKEKTQ